MTTDPEPADRDAHWRRPTGEAAEGGGKPPGPEPERRPEPAPYAGPPRSQPPPPGWRPPQVVHTPEPRTMPGQDHAAMDDVERSAATITTGIALVSGAVMLVMLLILCGRWML